MFDTLSDKIQLAFKHLKGNAHITEVNVSSVVKDIRKALLDADVHYKIAKDFTEKVKTRAIGEKIIGSLRPDQVMVKIMQDELTDLLGGVVQEPDWKGSPCVVLLAGLQGAGKTTFCGKLASFLSQKKFKPMLVAADVYRPAAMEQLKVLGAQINVPVYAEENEKDVLKIIANAYENAKSEHKNVLIIDTAGRQSVDETMMNEIKAIKTKFNPQEIFFVVDAMMGQDAVNTARTFNEYLDITGIVLSKLDGDTRGGAALSVKYTINKPIVFVSNGEKLENLDIFHSDRLAQRILGMGDIASFVEKTEALFNEEQAKKLEKKIRKNKFDFDDFKQQLGMIKKMGNVKDLLSMVPGVGKQIKNVNVDERQFIAIEAMINAMTPEERKNPECIDLSRKQRIAKGAGKTLAELNNFMNQFEQMKKMMQNMGNMGAMSNMMPPFMRKR